MTTEKAAVRLSCQEAAEASAAEVRRILLDAPMPVSEVGRHLAASSGKGARTALLCACAVGEDSLTPGDAVFASAAIELLHMATLVHDDIVDDAPVRRGIPSVQSRFGKGTAVLGGDWLLCMALRCASNAEYGGERLEKDASLLRPLISAAESVCLGELRQRGENGNLDLSLTGYLRIINQKTASLFCVAARVGAFLGGADGTETRLLVRFAKYLGIIFQIVDDVKDYTMEESDALKTVKNDLLSGVVTLPLILAFAREPALRPMAALAMDGGMDIAEFTRRVQRSGGIADAEGVTAACAKKAMGILEKLPSRYKRDRLARLLSLAQGAAVRFYTAPQ